MARTPETANQRRAKGAAHKHRMHRAMLYQNDIVLSQSSKQRRKKRAKQQQHDAAQHGAPYPHPEKRAYVFEHEAQQAMWNSWRSADGKKKPIRAYLCACGCWHLTAKAWIEEYHQQQ